MSYNSGDYNRGGMYAFVFAMVSSVLFFIWVAFVHPGIDLHEVTPPSATGAPALAQNKMPADADISGVKDPWNSSPAMIAHGHAIYERTCSMCHGVNGMGDGPAGKSLVPPPRNFVKGDWKKGGSEVDIFNVISNGIAGSSMAPWKSVISERDRWALVAFIQSITKNKISKPDQLKAFIANRK